LNNDLIEAIVALPTDMFYNTGIGTYLWIFDNAKRPERKGTVQLIDATGRGSKMRKSLGSKRLFIDESARKEIVRQYESMEQSETSKVFDNLDFAYWQITVERPLRLNFVCASERIALVADHKILGKVEGLVGALESFGQEVYTNRETFMDKLGKHLGRHGVRLTTAQRKTLWQTLGERDETSDICRVQTGKNKGEPEPDIGLRDTEIIPFGWNGHAKSYEARDETVQAYFDAEVKPHVEDAWIDWNKTKIGYEIPFTRHFYQYVPPRALEEIDADLNDSLKEILGLLNTVEESK
jgi:type I restriction enzyme M protein